MAIHRVLSSASRMRLMAPGCPSLMAALLETVLFARLTTVRLPPKRVCPLIDCGACPTTHMVVPLTSALLAPPGIGTLVLARAPVVGRSPDDCPCKKIMGAMGTRV